MIHSPGKTSPNCEIAILDVVYQPTSDNGPPTPVFHMEPQSNEGQRWTPSGLRFQWMHS